MNSQEILYVAVKTRVLAVNKFDGQILWTTKLPGTMGHAFVTLLADAARVFAHTQGKLHCLEASSGVVLWSNDLPGCGFGLASLAFPGGTSAPDAAQAEALRAAQEAASSHAAHAGTH